MGLHERGILKMISIIVFKFDENRIVRCPENITGQQDAEIIYVVSSDADKSLELLKRYTDHQTNIKIVSVKPSVTAIKALKEGVNHADGEYIWITDAADIIERDACETLAAYIRKDPVDILQFGIRIADDAGLLMEEREEIQSDLNRSKRYLKGEAILKSCFVDEKYDYHLLNKLFSAKLLKKAVLHFDEGIADVEFERYAYFIISSLAETYGSISDIVYSHWYECDNSGREMVSSGSLYDINSLTGLVSSIRRYAEKTGDRYIDEAADGFCMGVLNRYLPVYKDMVSISGGTSLGTLLEIFDPALVAAVFAKKYSGNLSTVTEYVRDCEIMNTERREIKTIGTFYNRLSNGGTERVLTLLVPIWRSLGYRVVIFTDVPPSPEDYELPADVIRIVLPDSDSAKNDYSERGKALQKALKDYNIDLLIYHAWISECLLWDLLVCKWNLVRFVIHCHNIFSILSIIPLPLFAFLPDIYSLSDGIVTLTRTDTEFWGMFHSLVMQTVNPMKYSSVEDIPRSPLKGRAIIWCQRFSEEKRPEDAVRIFRLVQSKIPDAELMMLGKGDDSTISERTYALAAEFGLEEKIHFLGYQKNVEDYYKKADICMITSEFEGFPLGLIESMGAGVPVVMYDLPYLTMVEKKKGIITVPDFNIKRMADEIIRLLSSEEKKEQLGKEARESVRELLTFDYHAKWKEILKSVQDYSNVPRKAPLFWGAMKSHYLLEIDHAERRMQGYWKEQWEDREKIRQLISERKELKEEIRLFQDKHENNSMADQPQSSIPSAAEQTNTAEPVLIQNKNEGKKTLLRLLRGLFHKLLPSSRYNVAWSYDKLTQQLQTQTKMLSHLMETDCYTRSEIDRIHEEIEDEKEYLHREIEMIKEAYEKRQYAVRDMQALLRENKEEQDK